MDKKKIMIRVIYGHSESRQFDRFENGRMVCYEYRIDYDRSGIETGRSSPEPLSSIGWDDGSPFTEADYIAITQ